MGLAELQVPSRPVLIKKAPAAVAARPPPPPLLAPTLLFAPIDDRPEPPDPNRRCTLLGLAEMSWAMMLVTPLVIGQWRGCWELMVLFTPETSKERVLWWSVMGGAGWAVVFALLRRPLTRVACSSAQRTLRQRVCGVLLSRLYLAAFAVASIAFWRGLWELIDLHCGRSYQLALFSVGLGGACLARLKCVRNLSGPPFMVVPDLKDTIFHFPTRYRTSDQTLSAWISLVIGCALHLVFSFAQAPLGRWLAPARCGRFVWLLSSRLYTTVFSFACVNGWRGVWQTLEHYTGSDLNALMATTTAAIVALAVMRTLRNIAAPPFAIVIDAHDGYFAFPTMFRVAPGSKDPALHTLDCIFSVFVVGSLVVIVWRGTWGILDIILVPEDESMSAWLSLAIGYGVTVVGFALQVPARIACDRLSGTPRLIVADLYQFLCFCGTVNLWRGVWNLLNIYFLPGTPLVSFWVTHWVCLILLMILCCGNSLLVRGVYIDGEEEGGQCVVFQVNYLRYHYKEKSKRQAAQGGHGQVLQASEKRKDGESAAAGAARTAPGLENHVHVPLMAHHMRDTIL